MRNVTKFLFGDCNYFDMLYSFFYKLMLSSLNLNNEKKNKISVIIITSVLSTFTMAQKILRIRALPSGVLNVPNAKYLAHLTHQTQKQALISRSISQKI